MQALNKSDLAPNPIEQFREWFAHAQTFEEIAYANAFCLSTVKPNGDPDGRILLLKSFNQHGFVFYTNTESVKGESLAKTPKACATFYWDPLGRQVRIRGDVTAVSDKEADEYFASRGRQSQIGAWASAQSQPLASREKLESKVAEIENRFLDAAIPRPPQWSGYLIAPREIELWQFGQDRLHNRFLYTQAPPKANSQAWNLTRLSP